jgi:5'(3')-deoxyribonucleotidase
MKPIILLDVDGVLADFVGHLSATCSALDVSMPPPGAWSFDFRSFLTNKQRKTAIGVLSDARSDGGHFARTLPVIEGAQDAVERLRLHGSVYIVTTPWESNPTWESERRAWLLRNFDVRPNHIVSTAAKYLVRGDLFVDDKPEHVAEWSAEHRNGHARLFNQPHNVSAPMNLMRVARWDCQAVDVLAHEAKEAARRRAGANA